MYGLQRKFTLKRRNPRLRFGTAIEPLENRSIAAFAEHGWAILPFGTQALRAVSNREIPTTTKELVRTAMGLNRDVKANTGIDPDRPTVVEFGRRLSHA